jgi:hypothetical protein
MSRLSSHPLVIQARAALRSAAAFRFCLRLSPSQREQIPLRMAWEASMQEARRCRLVAAASLSYPNRPRFNYNAIRALHAARMRSERLLAIEEGARCDAAFDGGEWSGPALDAIFESAERDIAQRVAERFGMSGEALVIQAIGAGYEHMERLQMRQQVARGAREAEEERQHWAHEEER